MTTTTDIDRRLATIATIDELHPIPNADAIVRARIRGWDVVVKKGEFEVGDPCVYFEIDSFLPADDERYAFLANGQKIRHMADGSAGYRLKTGKFRGQISQGLALPVTSFPELDDDGSGIGHIEGGQDVTEALGIRKWERPEMGDHILGDRPGWIPGTDAERIQNLVEILADAATATWVATEKLDGQSMTAAIEWTGGDLLGEGRWQPRITGRKVELKDTRPVNPDTTGARMWQIAEDLRLFERLLECGGGQLPGARRIAVQGEFFGEGIQGNPLGIKGRRFAAFDIVVDGQRLAFDNWPPGFSDLRVPLYNLMFPASVDEALAQVDQLESLAASGRRAEGIVWRPVDGYDATARVKVLSNRYLLKHDD